MFFANYSLFIRHRSTDQHKDNFSFLKHEICLRFWQATFYGRLYCQHLTTTSGESGVPHTTLAMHNFY